MVYIGCAVMFVWLVLIKRIINSAWKITADEGRGKPYQVSASSLGAT
jgi:hypothetical protein